MKKILLTLLVISTLFAIQSCNNSEKALRDEPFPGYNTSSEEPQLLAPGIIAGAYQTRDVAVTPDGREFYFGARAARHYTILVMRKTDKGWSEPEIVQHMEDPDWMNIEPALSYDGNKLYWLSNRPVEKEDKGGNQDIWVMDRTDEGWSKPFNLGAPVNSEFPEYYPSLTKDGTLYFTRNVNGAREAFIFRSKIVDGVYQEPEILPEQVNCGTNHYNAFIAHDESYIILPIAGREDARGGVDYYIVFRNKDDRWSNPLNLGEKINTDNAFEHSAYVSRDGKYLFFMSTRLREDPEMLTWKYLKETHKLPETGTSSIYWMSAGIIDSLKLNAVFE